MEAGEGRSGWQSYIPSWMTLLLVLAGCATSRAPIERAFRTPPTQTTQATASAVAYVVNCPDVVALEITTRPELSGRHEIGPDGRIDLPSFGRLRIEGFTVAEVARLVADALAVPPVSVRVQVVDYRSQHIMLIGQVVGAQRVVPFQGPETVFEVLRRTGGITPGAAPDEVYVIRSHLAEGQPPEVFRIDLKAIALGQDLRTNITLQPLDEVVVGQTRRCALDLCMPPWLRPFFETVCGMRKQEN
jgi:protein involved in polysaccharide export with SLBB domain